MRHAGTVKVDATGRTRDEALLRACAHVAEATRELASVECGGRAPHWQLDDSSCTIVVVQAGEPGNDLVAGVELSATFSWRES